MFWCLEKLVASLSLWQFAFLSDELIDSYTFIESPISSAPDARDQACLNSPDWYGRALALSMGQAAPLAFHSLCSTVFFYVATYLLVEEACDFWCCFVQWKKCFLMLCRCDEQTNYFRAV
jgi:hypothetical protein